MGIPYGGPRWSWPMRIIFTLVCVATFVAFVYSMSHLSENTP